MADIVLRLVKGSPLSDPELDANFTNLNRDSFLSVKNSIPWTATTAIEKGESLNITDRFYVAVNTGVTGATAPTHTSGTVANGTLQLQAAQIASYSAKDVFNKVKTMHGTGSGLDADLLDGLNPSTLIPGTSDKSSIVSRDASGNFTANVITATLNGNATTASSATTATTATNVNGGTANVSTLSATGDVTFGSTVSNTVLINGKLNIGGGLGTNGQFLMSRGTTLAPVWTTVSTVPTVVDDNSNNIRYLVFVDGTGTQPLKVDVNTTPLSYTPSNNTIDADISGTARNVSGGTGYLTSLNVGDQFYALSGGNVGLGISTPTEKFHVVGNIYDVGNIICTGNITAFFSSDAKFKTNVKEINGALDIVSQIGGKTFTWTQDYIAAQNNPLQRQDDFGVIAQDVKKAFPLAVHEREDGSLAVDYVKLISIAFAAINELKIELESLKNAN